MTDARKSREIGDVAAGLDRMLKAYARRVALADPEDLRDALELLERARGYIDEAATAMHDEHGRSWNEISAALGVSRQAVRKRWAIALDTPIRNDAAHE